MYYSNSFGGLNGIYLTISDSYDAPNHFSEGHARLSVVDILVNGRTKMIAVACLELVSQ